MAENFAKVKSVVIPRDREGFPQGYAFIYVESEEDVERLIEYADQRTLKARAVRIHRSEIKN